MSNRRAGFVPGLVGGAWSALRWAIRSRWLRVRGLTGDFEQGEDSDRSRRLTELWESKWPASEPIGYRLRVSHHDRWVRFHSLPGSKRYAEGQSEYDEILHRHHTVLAELLAGSPPDSLVVIAGDWGDRDFAVGWSKRHVPGAWPWRLFADADDDHESGLCFFFWVKTGLVDAELDALLVATADDQGRFVLAPADLDWLYCPYDGGADVILASPVERDILRERHADWLSRHPEGL